MTMEELRLTKELRELTIDPEFRDLIPPLTDEDMLAIAGIDKNCRLIKGQVFLWEGASDWQDLWDLDGTIAR